MAGPQQIRLRRRHRQAAGSFRDGEFFHREARTRLLDRLELIDLQPARCLDLGAGPLLAVAGLRQRFPQATLLAADHAIEMLRDVDPETRPVARICAAGEQLPLSDRSIDLVFSNLMLAYCRDPRPVLAEIHRVLASPGLFTFATLGPGSFQQLRAAWAAADRYTHCPPHPDMHDLGDLLVHSGFAEPVLDTETLTVTYPDLQRLHADLRAVGSVNHSEARNPGLTGRRAHEVLLRSLDRARDSEGRIPLTLELVFGHAWIGSSRPTAPTGEVSVPLAELRRRRPS
ncbi:MAG: methyltransferase domain-containing protein [Gammaproteobacteria bacterium]|nr:methyltransferase domain-containing protein [Gammaproteobacteria bacterium]